MNEPTSSNVDPVTKTVSKTKRRASKKTKHSKKKAGKADSSGNQIGPNPAENVSQTEKAKPIDFTPESPRGKKTGHRVGPHSTEKEPKTESTNTSGHVIESPNRKKKKMGSRNFTHGSHRAQPPAALHSPPSEDKTTIANHNQTSYIGAGKNDLANLNGSASSFRVNFDGSVTPTSSTDEGNNHGAVSATTKDPMHPGAASTTINHANQNHTSKPDSKGIEAKEEIIPSGNRRCWCFQTRGWLLCVLLCVLVAAAAGIVVPLFLLGDGSESDDGMLRLSEYPRSQIIAEVPDLCNEWIPGEGKSEICPVEQTASQGGDICNLLAQALLYSNESAEIAIVNAGACVGDISAPEMKARHIEEAVSSESLVIMEMSGTDIQSLLEQASESTFGSSGESSAYPYAAGLRFDVHSNLKFGNRVKKVEAIVDLIGEFRPINYRKFYTVITTKDLAAGDHGYSQLGTVIDKWKKELPYRTVDAFLNYALSDENWWVPDADASSTQKFVSPDTEIRVASVPNNICVDGTPSTGSGSSAPCSEETAVVGGGACNLVAWALLDQNLQADIAILNRAVCGSDVLAGAFTQSRANALLPGNPSLVTLELSGEQIVALLEEAIEAFIGESILEAYPFCSALRFNVNTSASKGARLSSIEFFTQSNRWIPLHQDKKFSVLTTSDLASGASPAYSVFKQADPDSLRNTRRSSVDALVKFASDWEVLVQPPREKISTQSVA